MNHRPLKITGGLLVALLVVYSGASWYAGRLAQRSIEAWVGRTNQDIAAQWGGQTPAPRLQVKSYARGLFRSDIEYVFSYRDEQGAAHELGLRDSLLHGPWPWAALREGVWQPLAAYSRVTPTSDGDWRDWSRLMPPGVAPWVAHTRIGFAGDVSAVAQFAPVKAEGVDFGGGSLQVSYDPEAGQTVLSAHVGRLALQDAATQATLTLSGLDVQARNRSGEDSNRQAHQRVDLAQLDFVPQGAEPIALRQQTLAVDAARTGDLLDAEADYQAGHVLLAGKDLGELRMTLSGQNLSVPALQALGQSLSRVQAAHAPGQALSPQEQQQIRGALTPVLAASPRLALRTLRWSNAQGRTELKAQADFRPAGDDASASLGDTLQQGIRALSLHLRLSKPMLLQVVRQGQSGPNADMALALVSMVFDQYVGRLERAGLVTQAGEGQVRMDLGYADGRVTANGVPMTPAEFGQRLDALQVGGL